MIQLDKNWRIETDENNVTLIKEESTGKLNKKGKEVVSKEYYYYGTLKQALLKYVDMQLRKEDSLEKVISRITELETLIKLL